MENEPRIQNLFYLSDMLFDLAKDIIKNPLDHNICNTISGNKSDKKQKYEIYNNFIGYLMKNIRKPNVKSQIEIESWKESIEVDEKYKDDALHNVREVFKRGHNKGFDFFQNNRKDYYYGIMPKSKDDFIDDFFYDLNNDEFGFYDDKKMTFQKYKDVIPRLFNEQAMFNFGFVNGAYVAFIEFTNSMPYSVKSKVFDYIENPKALNKQPHQESIKHPFKDDKTLDLFNYIVGNWNYKHDIKWAYIYNFLNDPKIYHNDYERYVRETQDFKGLFKYHNANSQKVYDALHDLKKAFIKNYR